ncbi:hypothetical protein KSS87_020214, partial [Heliosperma pusillum]
YTGKLTAGTSPRCRRRHPVGVATTVGKVEGGLRCRYNVHLCDESGGSSMRQSGRC